MQEINNLIKMLRTDYPLYLGEKNIKSLVHLIGGYQLRAKESEGVTLLFLPGFQQFVEKWYNVGFTEKRWDTIISSNCFSKEEAFDMFYHILDAFWEAQGIDSRTGDGTLPSRKDN